MKTSNNKKECRLTWKMQKIQKIKTNSQPRYFQIICGNLSFTLIAIIDKVSLILYGIKMNMLNNMVMLFSILVFIITITNTYSYPHALNKYSKNNKIYFVEDFEDGGYSGYVSLRAIQGIVNRKGARLLVICRNTYYQQNDLKWKSVYESQGAQFEKISTFKQLAHVFKDDFNNIITYDTPYTSDGWRCQNAELAVVLAGLTDSFPVETRWFESVKNSGIPCEDKVTLKKKGQPEKQVTSRLETLNLKNPIQAMRWQFNNLKNYANQNAFMQLTSEGIDYAVAKKMMYFELKTVSDHEQKTLSKEILQFFSSKGEIFDVWGWVEDEDKGIEEIGPYGAILKCVGASNMSLFSGTASYSSSWTQKTGVDINNQIYDDSKYYVAFVASENDTAKAPTTFQHGAWNDSKRGSVPISWGLNADLSNHMPALFDYYYGTATVNDYFFSGGGLMLGFVNPMLFTTNLIHQATTRTKALAHKTDQFFIDYYTDSIAPMNDRLLSKEEKYNAYIKYIKESDLIGFSGRTAQNPASFIPISERIGKEYPSTSLHKWGDTLYINRSFMYPRREKNKEQWEQIANFILANSENAKGKDLNSHFTVGYYGYIMTDDYVNGQFGKEPQTSEVMAVSPSMLKKVMDHINTLYPNKFVFTTLDKFVATASNAKSIPINVKRIIEKDKPTPAVSEIFSSGEVSSSLITSDNKSNDNNNKDSSKEVKSKALSLSSMTASEVTLVINDTQNDSQQRSESNVSVNENGTDILSDNPVNKSKWIWILVVILSSFFLTFLLIVLYKLFDKRNKIVH